MQFVHEQVPLCDGTALLYKVETLLQVVGILVPVASELKKVQFGIIEQNTRVLSHAVCTMGGIVWVWRVPCVAVRMDYDFLLKNCLFGEGVRDP